MRPAANFTTSSIQESRDYHDTVLKKLLGVNGPDPSMLPWIWYKVCTDDDDIATAVWKAHVAHASDALSDASVDWGLASSGTICRMQ